MMEICEAFSLIADLCIALGQTPVTRDNPDCFETDVDERWHLAVNGHAVPKMDARGLEVPPYSAGITFNGWPAGIVDPRGGVIAAGEAANEDTFIAALRTAIAKVQP